MTKLMFEPTRKCHGHITPYFQVFSHHGIMGHPPNPCYPKEFQGGQGALVLTRKPLANCWVPPTVPLALVY